MRQSYLLRPLGVLLSLLMGLSFAPLTFAETGDDASSESTEKSTEDPKKDDAAKAEEKPSTLHVREGAWELGLQLGGYFFLNDKAVPFDRNGPEFPGPLTSTFAYTLHGAYNFTKQFALELALQVSPAESNRLTVFNVHLDAILNIIQHEWIVPFLGFGPSISSIFPQSSAYKTDVDPGINAMFGLKFFPWDRVGIRADIRYLLRIPTSSDAKDGRQEEPGHDIITSLGIFGEFGGKTEEIIEEPVILDRDGDGILDDEDACPDVPGVASANGCPDRDGDGIPDDKDRCPDDPGTAEFDGCPDTDGDGLADLDDRCPDEAGPAEFDGCPDSDGDGIPDVDDHCPTIAGEKEFNGCPPPPPEEVVKRFSGSIDGITFDLDKDTIRASSHETLDEAVAVLKEFPQLSLVIEGHTSAEGGRDYNMDLSKRRADSVKAYLIEKGIDESRISTEAYGPDKPIASNDTASGRQKNRRIEFRIIQPGK